jgi:hypothetical protein
MYDQGVNPETLELNPCPEPDKLRHATPLYGAADTIVVLLMMLVGLFLEKFWVKEVIWEHELHDITPGEFAIRVFRLPRYLHDDEDEAAGIKGGRPREKISKKSGDDTSILWHKIGEVIRTHK